MQIFSCKKDKIITSSSAKIRFSQDSVLFDTVFTTIGSATRNIRIVNDNSQKIKISGIQLQNAGSSPFIINVDGSKGTTFTDVEIAAHDSIYIFIQVNVNPTNANSPAIISDAINVEVNGNHQSVYLEAWGQDAYYHYPTNAIKFSDGSYLSYSTVDTLKNSYDLVGGEYVWKNDKPHVVYGYLVVDSTQKLKINAGTRVYMNYKAGLWVYRYGQIQVLGTKGNEVIFQGARREQDWANEPGQWDRIWINEGSNNNIIDYAIIKNAYVGLQTEVFGNTFGLPGRLRLTNTRIQNMSLWGLYSLGYNIYGGNNSISNCQEYCVNILLGGNYNFIHCTFANYWDGDKARDKPTIFINNHTTAQVLPLDTCVFANCLIDGKLDNELGFDLNTSDNTLLPKQFFRNCWIKTNIDVSDVNHYFNIRTGTSPQYADPGSFIWQPKSSETQVQNFINTQATQAATLFPADLNGHSRNTSSVTVGAYEPS
jgi:hypothetical protein